MPAAMIRDTNDGKDWSTLNRSTGRLLTSRCYAD